MQNWHPSAQITTLKERAEIIQKIRNFFYQRGYLEVETPCISQYGVSDPYLVNVKTRVNNKPYYLQTSPEYHMKRLLSYGSGAIFQIARVFRDDEIGRVHNPEFSLLEWYHPEIDHHGLMAETSDFLQEILYCKPLEKLSYEEAFRNICDIDPFNATIEDFKKLLERYELGNVLDPQEQDRDQYLFLIMSHIIEKSLEALDHPVAIYDFPKSQAALAKVVNNTAQRFEVYYKGVELANGFNELLDPDIQKQRFINDNAKRKELNLEQIEPNKHLINALKHGMPDCSGIALGIDRLLMLALGKREIKEVLAFDIPRA